MTNDETQIRSDELNWLAVRYVSGEMTEAEAAAFEERLGTDELACEAVSKAVQMTLAVRAAFDEKTTVGQVSNLSVASKPNRLKTCPTARVATKTARRISLTAAAVAVLAVLFLANRHEPNGVATAQSERDRALAVLWTQAGLEMPAIPEMDDPGEAESPDSDAADPTEDEHRPPPVDLVADVPEWLLVALASQSGADEDEDEILEN